MQRNGVQALAMTAQPMLLEPCGWCEFVVLLRVPMGALRVG